MTRQSYVQRADGHRRCTLRRQRIAAAPERSRGTFLRVREGVPRRRRARVPLSVPAFRLALGDLLGRPVGPPLFRLSVGDALAVKGTRSVPLSFAVVSPDPVPRALTRTGIDRACPRSSPDPG